MKIDAFLEWFVIFCGVMIALSVWFPGKAEEQANKITDKIPHPSDVNDWINKYHDSFRK